MLRIEAIFAGRRCTSLLDPQRPSFIESICVRMGGVSLAIRCRSFELSYRYLSIKIRQYIRWAVAQSNYSLLNATNGGVVICAAC
jgi:hypothetical protein